MIRSTKTRNLTWEDYEISKNLQEELKAFCLQYHDKKKVVNQNHAYSNKELVYRGVADIRFTVYKADCDYVERAAKAANESIYPYLLKSVTQNLAYERIEYDDTYGRIPMGKTDFYGYRRLFYYNLHLLKLGTNRTYICDKIITGSI